MPEGAVSVRPERVTLRTVLGATIIEMNSRTGAGRRATARRSQDAVAGQSEPPTRHLESNKEQI